MSFSPDQLHVTLERLRKMRHAKVMTAPKPDADGSLLPILNASAEVGALDTCIRLLERELREVAS